MNKVSEYSRGSEWRKWDLHIHSPLSVLNNQYPKNSDGNPKWEIFLDKLEEFEGVAVIGITDYFSIDGYKEILKFKDQGRLKNFATILPNIELRLGTFVVKNKSREINFHIIFSNKLKINYIEKEFLELLEIQTEGSINGISGKRQLNEDTIIEIGKKIKQFNPNYEKDSYKEAAFKNINVSLEKVQQLLQKKIFKGKFLFILSGGEWANIDWHQAYLDKKNFLQAAHILETGSFDTISWALGKKNLSEEEFIKEFGVLKPSIFGSDAHRLEQICNPPDDKYCWIKADPTFEGLKQIIYEPKERVRIQKDNPTTFKSTYSLKSISISNSKISSDLEIIETKIPLNRDSVTVIGGKGTGKTAILDLIANCYVDRVNSSDKNSFARRISEDGEDLKINLKFIDSSDFSKILVEDNFINHSRIEYIPQGQIENLTSDHKSFHKYLQNLIFESEKIKDSKILYEYERIKQDIKRAIENIKQLNREIFDLENETKIEHFLEISREIKLNKFEKENIKKEIETFKSQLEPQSIKRSEKIQEALSGRIDQRKKLSDLLDLISDTLEKFEIFELLNKNIKLINTLLSKLFLDLNKVELIKYDNAKTQLESIKDKVQVKLTKISKEIEKIRKDIDSMEEKIRRHSLLLKQLDDIDRKIKEFNNKLNHIKEKKGILKKKLNDRLTYYKNFLKSFIQIREKYDEIIDAFSQEAQEILLGLEFRSSLEFDFNKFEKLGEDVVDLRSLRAIKDEKVSILQSDQFKRIIELIKQIKNIDIKKSENLLLSLTDEIKNKLGLFSKILKPTRNNLHLYEWLFGNYYFLITNVFFNNISLGKLSLGQKCTVLLKTYLAQGKNPILIDQPDDNLDNEFIMFELITALRQAKKNRQVIIVTNNANLVINSDAEQIIIARFKKGKISYILGSIENPIIRKNAIDILEGGPEAFRNREKKYGFYE